MERWWWLLLLSLSLHIFRLNMHSRQGCCLTIPCIHPFMHAYCWCCIVCAFIENILHICINIWFSRVKEQHNERCSVRGGGWKHLGASEEIEEVFVEKIVMAFGRSASEHSKAFNEVNRTYLNHNFTIIIINFTMIIMKNPNYYCVYIV